MLRDTLALPRADSSLDQNAPFDLFLSTSVLDSFESHGDIDRPFEDIEDLEELEELLFA